MQASQRSALDHLESEGVGYETLVEDVGDVLERTDGHNRVKRGGGVASGMNWDNYQRCVVFLVDCL